ncbi:MAG: GNAT family N-acetyltransferase [Pseudomonadota bacterium]
MITDDYFVEPATWRFDESAIRAVRTEVFIVEQQVPEDEEWDDDDPTAQHFLALDQTGSAIGTARLTRDGRIGRVAVLKYWRRKKVGDALLRAAVEAGSLQHLGELRLAAQTYATGFYQRHGFEPYGEIFQDVGIDHVWMRRELSPPAPASPSLHERPEAGDQNPGRSDFDDRVNLLRQWHEQLKATRRRLTIFSRDLDRRVLDQPLLMEQLRSLAVCDLRPQIRILVLDSGAAVQACHPLIALAQRLPSVIQIRRPAKDHQDYPSAFSVGDEHHLLLRPFGDQFDGYSMLWHRREARRQLELFDPMWEAASPDPNFRRLAL